MKNVLALSIGIITFTTASIVGQDTLEDSSQQLTAESAKDATFDPQGRPTATSQEQVETNDRALGRPGPGSVFAPDESSFRGGGGRLGGGGRFGGGRDNVGVEFREFGGGSRGRRRSENSGERGIVSAIEKSQKLLMDSRMQPEDLAKTTQRLQASLGELFDLRTKTREKQIADLETRIETLRKQLDERKAKKDEIVQLRLQTIINESNGLTF